MTEAISEEMKSLRYFATQASVISIWVDEAMPGVVVRLGNGEIECTIVHRASSVTHARILYGIADGQPIESPTYMTILQTWLRALLGASEAVAQEPIITWTRSSERTH